MHQHLPPCSELETPPAPPLLQEAGVLDQGIEVVFFGSDTGVEDVRDIKMQQHMARSMAVADALEPHNLLCYEMNGEPLPQSHGFPLRLIAPGWYGIANTKWPQSIQILPTRYQNRFMARDYVTIREQQLDGQLVWTETSVGRALLKSVPAKVTRTEGQYRIVGAAWGSPIAKVEVQIDGGPWLPAMIDGGRTPSLPGSCGHSTGQTRGQASTASPRGQLTRRAPPAGG